MNGIIVEGNTLTIGHTKIIVKYPIKKIEKINGKYIVLLKIPRVELGVDELNNILCYDLYMAQWNSSSPLFGSWQNKG